MNDAALMRQIALDLFHDREFKRRESCLLEVDEIERLYQIEPRTATLRALLKELPELREIVRRLANGEELHEVLRVPVPPPAPPQLAARDQT